MIRRRSGAARLVLDDVVETHLQPGVLAELAEGVRLRRAGIEHRQHVADADVAMAVQFLDAADGDGEGDEGGVDGRAHRWPACGFRSGVVTAIWTATPAAAPRTRAAARLRPSAAPAPHGCDPESDAGGSSDRKSHRLNSSH